jgi:hypothetical protein
MHRGRSRAELADVVVLEWLAHGPAQVPTRQVRRALRTYRDAAPSRRATRKAALKLAELLAGGPGLSRTARCRFIDAYETAVNGGELDLAALTLPIFDPAGVGAAPLRSAIAPATLVAALEAWRAGCRRLDDIDDSTLDASRNLCIQVAAHPSWQKLTRSTVPLDAQPTELLRRNACACVLLALGTHTAAGAAHPTR